MANYITNTAELTSIANAIRTKGGTAASLTYPTGFVSAINAIPSGGGGNNIILSALSIDGEEELNILMWEDGIRNIPSACIEVAPGSTVLIDIGSGYQNATAVGVTSEEEYEIVTATEEWAYIRIPEGTTEDINIYVEW